MTIANKDEKMMAKKKPILSLNDKRAVELLKKCAWIYVINKRVRAFTYNDKPRHGGSFIGLYELDVRKHPEFQNKTISEQVIIVNSWLSKGIKLDIKKGTKVEKPVEINPANAERKPPRWELVKDWDAPKVDKRQDISKEELDRILSAPVPEVPEYTLREWQALHPNVNIVNHGDVIYVSSVDDSLYLITDYVVIDKTGDGKHNVGKQTILKRRWVPKEKTLVDILIEENKE